MTKLAFFGSPQFAVPILQALSEEFEVKLVVTQPAKAVGNHRSQLQPSALELAARELGLTVATPVKLRDEDFKVLIGEIEVDVAVVAAYGKILPQWLLDWPKHGMINVHGSLLPAYRGASPINAAIADGLTETGITIMTMSAGMDEGDMLQKFSLPIAPDDTTASLAEKMSRLAAKHVSSTVTGYLEGTITPQPQPSEGVSYCQLLSTEDGRIDLSQPPANLDNLIRAYYPWPGVWGEFHGQRVKLLPNNMVQLEGKKPTPLADFKRGYPDFPL